MSDPVVPAYRLAHVRPLSFADRTGRLPDDPEALPPISYAPAFSVEFDAEARTIRVIAAVSVLVMHAAEDAAPAEPQVPIAEVEVGCTFEFEGGDAFEADGRVQVPRWFVAQLIGMTLSSARGILVGRSPHVLFQVAPLPIASPILFVDALVEGLDWVAPRDAA